MSPIWISPATPKALLERCQCWSVYPPLLSLSATGYIGIKVLTNIHRCPNFFNKCHQKVKVLTYSVKYLNIYWMDWRRIATNIGLWSWLTSTRLHPPEVDNFKWYQQLLIGLWLNLDLAQTFMFTLSWIVITSHQPRQYFWCITD